MAISEFQRNHPVPGAVNIDPKRIQGAGASSTIQHTGKVPDERRRHQRAKVFLHGRFMRQNEDENPCQITNASAGGVLVKTMTRVEPYETIVIYAAELGRLEGRVVRTFSDGFALKLNASQYKREKIASQLTWLVNKDHFASVEDREHDRIIPRKPHARLELADGTVADCIVLDVSLGGAAISIDRKPDVGSAVILGLIPGHVIRHSADSVSIQFAKLQNPDMITRQFG